MDRAWTGVQFLLVGLIAWWAGVNNIYKILLILNILDVISGVVVASKTGTLKSSIGKQGLRLKALIWIMILGLAIMQDEFGGLINAPQLAQLPITYGPAEVTAAGFAFMEWISIIENAQKLGLRVPAWMKAALDQAKKLLGYDDEPGNGS